MSSRRPSRTHAATLLSATAVTTSALALNPVLEPGRWTLLVALECLVLAYLTAALRTWLASRSLPTLLAALATGYVLGALYLGEDGPALLPDGESLERLGVFAATVRSEVLEGVAPVPVSAPMELAVLAGSAACYLLVELVCFGLRVPLWAGAALLALWVPAVVVYVEVPAATFLVAACSWLALVVVASDSPALDEQEARRRTVVSVTWTAALAVVTLALSPLLVTLPGWGTNPVPQLAGSGGGAMLLTADLDVRASLGRQSNEVALRYRADPVAPGALRLRSVAHFDGRTWAAGPAGQRREFTAEELLWPLEPDLEEPSVTRLEVEIVGLREQNLPVPTVPRTVDAPGTWAYEAETDEVVSPSRTLRGMRYAVEAVLPWFDADTLRRTPVGSGPSLDPYLQLPATSHLEDVERVVEEVTAGARTQYDAILALQTYLRSRPFVYDTQVPEPQTDDAVWDFLQSKHGYCVQFATAMTVMARMLGVPARMAVGFLPGTATGRGEDRVYEVRGDRAHTWPELYFEGIGWVRFEPTPPEQSGFPPSYADPFANQEPEPTIPVQTPTAFPTPTVVPTPGAGAGAGRGTLSEVPTALLVTAGAVVLLVLAGAVLLVLRLQGRRRRELVPETAWALLRERLADLGVTWPDSRTPRQVVAWVAAQIERRRREPVDPEVLGALRLLAGAVEQVRYAPRPQVPDAEVLEEAVEAVMAGTVVTDRARDASSPSAPRAGS